ncbi:PEF-CTERM sorting domain-containing protein [Methanolobus sp. WCC5]
MPGLRNNGKIPEFPTIALPMLAIIGLALIFRRKE